MERKIYQMTEKQTARFAGKPTQDEVDAQVAVIRSGINDEAYKTSWKRRHGGKVAGWGLEKAQTIITLLQGTIEYQRGIWQGRVDAAIGCPYSEERSQKSYNLGYYRGYLNYESDRRGWQQWQRDEFDAFINGSDTKEEINND